MRQYKREPDLPGYVWVDDDTLIPESKIAEYEAGQSRPDYAPLLERGVGMTSGYRDPAYNKKVGGVANSLHTTKDAIDLVPGKSGLSMRELEQEARQLYPDATELLNEGDHVHVGRKGWGGAPDIMGKGTLFADGLPEPEPEEQPDHLSALRRAMEAQDDPETAQAAAEIYADANGIELDDDTLAKAMPDKWRPKFVDPQTEEAWGPTGLFNKVVDERDEGLPEGLREGYRALFSKGPVSPDDIRAYFKAHGFDVLNADKVVEDYQKARTVNDNIQHREMPQLKAINRDDMSMVEKFGSLGEDIGRMLGLKHSGRMGRELESLASWTPIGGASAVEEGLEQITEGDVGGGLANAALGGLDFIPAVGPIARVTGKGGGKMAEEIAEWVARRAEAPTARHAPEMPAFRAPDATAGGRLPPPGDVPPPGGGGGPERGDFAGNINLKYLTDDQKIREVIYKADEIGDSFTDARRGVVSEEQTALLANDLGWNYDDLLKRRKGQAFSAEQALRARQMLHQSGTEVAALAEKASAEGGDEAVLAFQEALTRHVAIQEQVAGMTAEAGRALRQFQMRVDGGVATPRITREMIDRLGGEGDIRRVAGGIADLARSGADPGQLNTAIRAAMKPGVRDWIESIVYNFRLSGPRTHVVNTLSNTLTTMLQIPEHVVASAIGKADNILTGQPERVLWDEVGARATGMLQGLSEGAEWAKRAWKNDETFDGISKLDREMKDPLGKFGVATRALSAEDEFFKGVARRMEINAMAVRQAKTEGLRGEALTARIAELSANPTDEMMDRAIGFSRYVTFQTELGKAGKAGQQFAEKVWPLKMVFMPFIRTPVNLFKYAAERSPLAVVMPRVWNNWKAGGESRHLAMARVLMGSAFGALVAAKASEGMISGGVPKDRNRETLMRADGWQPYSIKIGDKWVSYQRGDPISTTIGWAADFVALNQYMTAEEAEDYAGIVSASIAEQLTNKSYLTGISDAATAFSDPKRYMNNWASNALVGMATPALLAQATQAIDPTLRETRADTLLQTIKQKVMSRIPGLSDNLQARRDIFGRKIVDESGAATIVNPMRVSTQENDPTIEALLEADASVNDPQRTVTIGGVEIKLPRKSFNRYRAASGIIGKMYLDALTKSPEWQKMSGDEKRDAVADAMRDAREFVRENPELWIKQKEPAD